MTTAVTPSDTCVLAHARRSRGIVLAKQRVAARRARLAVPVRVEKHIARLGLYSATDYVEWCRARGFRADVRKSWGELEREWCAYGRELAKARRGQLVDRDPEKLLTGVCSGVITASDIARPRWRALAERIERAGLAGAQREALRVLVEIVCRRGNLLLAEGRFGDRMLPFVDGLLSLSLHHELWMREPVDWHPRSHNARRQFTSLARQGE